jgi:hypothetical protein
MTGIHIQTRLHPTQENEDIAIDVFTQWIDAGNTPRQTITSALLALDGFPVPTPVGMITTAMLQDALNGIVDVLADVVGDAIDARMSEFAHMSPTERREEVRETVRRSSSFSSSILNAVNVAELGND